MTTDEQWIIVHDGSYHASHATYAWKLIHHSTSILQGCGTAPGNPSTALRAELYGLMAWYCSLYHIFKYFDITPQVHIWPYLDNNTKLIKYHTHVLDDTIPNESYIDDYDILLLLKHYHSHLVKGRLQIHHITKIHLPTKDKTKLTDPIQLQFQQVDQMV